MCPRCLQIFYLTNLLVNLDNFWDNFVDNFEVNFETIFVVNFADNFADKLTVNFKVDLSGSCQVIRHLSGCHLVLSCTEVRFVYFSPSENLLY